MLFQGDFFTVKQHNTDLFCVVTDSEVLQRFSLSVVVINFG